MMSTLGGLSVLVAMLGVYALCAHAVERRTHELAVRVALGASGRQVRQMVVRHTLHPVMWGLGVGLGAAAALSTLLSSLLFGIDPHDWLAFTVVPAGLGLTAVGSAWMSARGAALVDPVIALRE
jgi:ABC-type antimicrobial peptide transport system permease subunit